LASRNREPRRAWTELNSWAFGKGPTAVKAAIMGFLDQHGSRPESVAIIPEIARAASQLPPIDRSAMLSLTNRSFSMPSFGSGILNIPKHGVAMHGDRPALSLNFQARQMQRAGGSNIATAPAVHAPGIAQMIEARDSIFSVNDQIKEAGALQKQQSLSHSQPSGVKVAQVTSESFKPMIKSVDSHTLVRSLIAKVRSHSSDDAAYLSPSPTARPKAVRVRKPARSKPVKVKARKRAAVRKAAKPVKRRTAKVAKRKPSSRAKPKRARPKARKSRRK
jgi:hypothetical protein